MAYHYRQYLGWTAVVVSTIISGFWAFWGIIENFHEGWFAISLWRNLAIMLIQYLSLMFVFMGAALTALRWPAVGGSIYVSAAIAAALFFGGKSPAVIYPFIVAPLAGLGLCYWLGRPEPRRWAVAIVVVIPLLTLIVCGIEPAYRVSQRMDDGDRSARRIVGNGVDLIWAPEGPGWPRRGVSWKEAQRRCIYLAEDGLSLSETAQNIWRLPTVEEVVLSMHRHGQNCGGIWDPLNRCASYKLSPDKESPLWDVHSQVIYWWTSTEVNEREALIIVYDGKAWPRSKFEHMGSLGFRAVRGGSFYNETLY